MRGRHSVPRATAGSSSSRPCTGSSPPPTRPATCRRSTASSAGGLSGQVAYAASKAGLLGLVKTLALEGAPVGIRASAVCPGYVRTALVEQQIADQSRTHGVPEERVLEDVLLAPQALKRPSEVADAAAYLLGPGGALFTGAPLVMDGGWTAR